MSFSPDISNKIFQLAVRFVNQTNQDIFLTGKAGTGKTTFLKYIYEHSFKKMAIVAPTGVAAINAGGVTMHSLFQLPLGAFIPTLHSGWNSSSNFNTPHTLLKNFRLNNDKRQLLQELELLVIDEVSMLRADLLDEIDTILRHFRKRMLEPFGGVQLLYIGDLFQLPPVVKNEEWQILKEHYRSPFFFDAHVIQQKPPLYLELKRIYRQHELDFIAVLNNIRNNRVTADDLEILHRHYIPDYECPDDENYITLTTHNAKADRINQYQLAKLTSKQFEFKGEVKGDFNEKALPAEPSLQLKEGAQIMFIKNDKGEYRRYYNGKIANIARIDKDKIHIRFPGEKQEMELQRETWRNIRYQYNKEKDILEEEEIGSFKQYPIRLAWAITIHKSQGLTFEKAIIDAGASFAPGQVYVALSRLTSMQGLILRSRIQPHCINTDDRVLEFTQLEKEEGELEQELQQGQKIFIARSLLQIFDWLKLAEAMQMHFEDYEQRLIPDKNECVQWAKDILDAVLKQQQVAQNFMKELNKFFKSGHQGGYQYLHQRISAGSDYFLKEIAKSAASVQKHIEEVEIKNKVRKYVKSLRTLYLLFERRKVQLKQAVQIVEGLAKEKDTSDLIKLIEKQRKSELKVIEKTDKLTGKPQKGDSHRMSLQMFREAKNIAEIAQLRGLAISTIQGHLASFITSGEIDIKEIVSENGITTIIQAIEDLNLETANVAPVKEKLGDDFSYNDIKAVFNYIEWLQLGKVEK